MIRVCQITRKRPMHGNKRSHAMNATKRLFIPNLHVRRFWIPSKKCFLKLRVCAKGIRLIDKLGIEHFYNTKTLYKKRTKVLKHG